MIGSEWQIIAAAPVHAESVMHHTCVMFCPNPIFRMFMLS